MPPSLVFILKIKKRNNDSGLKLFNKTDSKGQFHKPIFLRKV